MIGFEKVDRPPKKERNFQDKKVEKEAKSSPNNETVVYGKDDVLMERCLRKLV